MTKDNDFFPFWLQIVPFFYKTIWFHSSIIICWQRGELTSSYPSICWQHGQTAGQRSVIIQRQVRGRKERLQLQTCICLFLCACFNCAENQVSAPLKGHSVVHCQTYLWLRNTQFFTHKKLISYKHLKSHFIIIFTSSNEQECSRASNVNSVIWLDLAYLTLVGFFPFLDFTE